MLDVGFDADHLFLGDVAFFKLFYLGSEVQQC